MITTFEKLGGRAQSHILGSKRKTSIPVAAFVNAELSSALDADEVLLNSSHQATAIVPGALAIAESLGSSGKELITAVAVGYDVAARIGL